MQITAYRAGHVLGACMFMIEIAGARVLYTGDYSRLADRHLSPADLPEVQPDVGEAARKKRSNHSLWGCALCTCSQHLTAMVAAACQTCSLMLLRHRQPLLAPAAESARCR